MKFEQAMKALAAAGRRAHVVGDAGAGVIAALDVEGRLFPVWGGEILTRINPEALAGQSTRDRYINPGGDGLWPAPEGTTLGYQYAAGAWRVPPGLVAARYRVLDSSPRGATLCAEVDLVNNRGGGIPLLFRRRIAVSAGTSSFTMRVVESLIRDAAPDLAPSRKGVRYSVYSDPAGFMEIEAVGGCPAVLRPGVELSVEVNTRFERI